VSVEPTVERSLSRLLGGLYRELTLEGQFVSPQRLGRRLWQWLSLCRRLATPASSSSVSAATRRMVRRSHDEVGKVNAARVFCESVGVGLQVVSFEVHFRVENDEFLLQAFFVETQEVIFPEVALQRVVVQVVVRPAWRSSVAYMTPLVLLAAMDEQFIVAIEGLLAETTLGVSLEAALVYGSRLIVSVFLMLPQLFWSKQIMLVSKDFLVLRTEVAHDLLMRSLDMIVKVSPA
jgi:hypothetical protein